MRGLAHVFDSDKGRLALARQLGLSGQLDCILSQAAKFSPEGTHCRRSSALSLHDRHFRTESGAGVRRCVPPWSRHGVSRVGFRAADSPT